MRDHNYVMFQKRQNQRDNKKMVVARGQGGGSYEAPEHRGFPGSGNALYD